MQQVVEEISTAGPLFIAENGEVRLKAGQCARCESLFFPAFAITHRLGCRDGEVKEILLGATGVVSSYTVQYFPPPWPFTAPDPFIPFPVATVGFPEGLEVIGRVIDVDGDTLSVGLPVEVCTVLLEPDDGETTLTWAFRPNEPRSDGSE
jgi:uncharacterized protein